MRDVFISYSQPDRDCAFELVAHLEQQGMECWIAPRDVEPSADWAAEIIEAISRARVMVLIFSASSNDSPQVRREVERAVHKQVNILPFRIENVLPSKSLEYFLSSQHWLDAFPPPREPHYARLSAYLSSRAPLPPAKSLLGKPTFGEAQMRHIERQLACYIGPLAKHLVKLAAMRAAGIDDLIAQLALELDSETERRDFVRRCTSIEPGG